MVVHGTYLTRDSDFFKAALKKEWSEGQTRTINLAEERPGVMAQYIGYAYSKRLSSEERVHTRMDDFKHADHLLAMLLRLWRTIHQPDDPNGGDQGALPTTDN
jgi:hypothetical protein